MKIDADTVELVTKVAKRMARSNPLLWRDVDDLVQEGLIGLWNHEPSDTDTIGLLRVIAKHRMVDWLRTQYGRTGSRRLEASSRVGSLDAPVPTLPGTPYAQIVVSQEPDAYASYDTFDALQEALSNLAPRYREVLRLTLLDWPLLDIGEHLGVSESRACQLLADARHALTHRGCKITGMQCRRNQAKREQLAAVA